MNTFERFNETKLPEKEKYYSTLTKKHLTDEEYDFAKPSSVSKICCPVILHLSEKLS